MRLKNNYDFTLQYSVSQIQCAPTIINFPYSKLFTIHTVLIYRLHCMLKYDRRAVCSLGYLKRPMLLHLESCRISTMSFIHLLTKKNMKEA